MSALTCERVLPAPNIGARIASMRFCVLRSTCCTYLSWFASSPDDDGCWLSRLPSWSTIVTFLAGMSGTPEATMRVIASTWPSSSTRPG